LSAQAHPRPGGAGTGGDPFRRLRAGGWVCPSRDTGTPAWTPRFEQVIADLQAALSAPGSPGPAWYPPVMPRADAERAGYAESFYHLLGAVHAMAEGTEPAGRAADVPPATGLVLIPAMCYHIYPLLAGQVLPGPATFDLSGYCYRHEGTSEVGRCRSYRVRELLAVADAATALRWRDEHIDEATAFFRGLGVAVRVAQATDPFFGRGGALLRRAQLEQRLKFEFVTPVFPGDPGTAIASANYHKDHFGTQFQIRCAGGDRAHSACMGFGLERVALALIHQHGDDRRNWPAITRVAAGQPSGRV
jgi:seryl-tRNA synthetase